MIQRSYFAPAAVAILALAIGGAANAQIVNHDTVRCEPIPKEEMKPQMELQRKLTSEGWKVRQVKNLTAATRSTASMAMASAWKPSSTPRPSRKSAK